MKKSLVISFIAIILTSQGISQNYETAIGVRAGFYNGLTIKHSLGGNAMIEGILTTRWKGFNVTGLYELHNSTNVNGLNWYVGAGAHLGVWNGSNVNWANDNNGYTVIGIDGILGLEYNFEEVPFNVSLDWKPSMNLIGYNGFWGDGFALSLRYIL